MMQENIDDNDRDRAQVMIPDIVTALFVLVAILVVAPTLYEFVGMATASAGGFTSMLLQLVVPFLFIALIVSVGVSARRRGGV